MTANVHDARDPVEGILVTVLRQRADLWQRCRCTDIGAVERLRRLITTRSS